MSDFATPSGLLNEVRLAVYQGLIDTGAAPSPDALARTLARDEATIAAALGALAEQHVLVLDEQGAVRMAMPFSAVPTGFRVRSGERSWWANCAWDALGIPAALEIDATIEAACGCCAAPLAISVAGDRLLPGSAAEAVAHFAVPARAWWADIGFT